MAIKKTPDGKYQVTNETGTKVLGTHSNEAQAKAQLAAVEISKKRKRALT